MKLIIDLFQNPNEKWEFSIMQIVNEANETKIIYRSHLYSTKREGYEAIVSYMDSQIV